MRAHTAEPRWLSRLEEIPSQVEEIRLPNTDGLSQDREWCEAIVDGRTRRYRFHNYGELYKVPGLYEKLFYESLKCCSPSRVARLLDGVIRDFQEEPEELRVLDVGAGNGMVGDELTVHALDGGADLTPELRRIEVAVGRIFGLNLACGEPEAPTHC